MIDKSDILKIKYIFFVILLLTSCSSKQQIDQNSSFTDLMTADDLNKTIEISNLDFMTEGLDPNVFAISIQNNTDYQIKFPINFGVRIFMYNENQDDWIEINNEGDYLPSNTGRNPTILGKGSTQDKTSFPIFPVIPEKKSAVKIRVFVIGKITSILAINKKTVVAYTDIIVPH